LFNWVLPADHVLAGPWGLTVFVVTNVDGQVIVRGREWRESVPLWRRFLTLGRRPLGNPVRLAQIEIDSLAGALAAAGVDVPIDAAVLLSHPAAALDAEASEPPALRPDDLAGWLRKQRTTPELSAAKRRQLDLALDGIVATRVLPAHTAPPSPRRAGGRRRAPPGG
jgi:hypothetical protein